MAADTDKVYSPLEKAALQKHTGAQRILGVYYEESISVSEIDEKTVERCA